jgi:hypothetical protein
MERALALTPALSHPMGEGEPWEPFWKLVDHWLNPAIGKFLLFIP